MATLSFGGCSCLAGLVYKTLGVLLGGSFGAMRPSSKETSENFLCNRSSSSKTSSTKIFLALFVCFAWSPAAESAEVVPFADPVRFENQKNLTKFEACF